MRMLKMWINRRLAGAWRTWLSMYRMAVYQRWWKSRMVVNACKRWMQRDLSAAFARWVEMLDNAKWRWARLNKAMQYWVNRALAAAFMVFVLHCNENKRMRHLLKRHMLHWRYKTLALAFRTWDKNTMRIRVDDGADARDIELFGLEEKPAPTPDPPKKACCHSCVYCCVVM